MSKNKVTFGLDKVHIAFEDTTVPDQPAWKTPVAVPGAVRWTPEAQGESTPFYADNMTYYVATSNNGYTGELEMANIPDEILAEMLGWEIDDNGMLVEVADAQPKKFALLGQVQGDKRNRRFAYYDCQATRPSKERTTKGESVEPTTDVLDVNVSPIEIDNRMIVKGDLELSETNATAFNSFFTTVYLPKFTVPTP
jgi:phi13 family phage major tail protein